MPGVERTARRHRGRAWERYQLTARDFVRSRATTASSTNVAGTRSTNAVVVVGCGYVEERWRMGQHGDDGGKRERGARCLALAKLAKSHRLQPSAHYIF